MGDDHSAEVKREFIRESSSQRYGIEFDLTSRNNRIMDRSCQRSAIRFKVLTLFTLAYAFKTADSSPYIEAKRDIYVLDDKGNLLQKRIDDNGETWYSSSDVNKLEILVNDGIKDNIVSSCILDTPTAKAQPQMKNKSLHFENIAMVSLCLILILNC